MRFDLESGTSAMPLRLMLDPSAKAILTFPISLEQIIWPLAMVKSHAFGCIFSTYKLWLFVRCHDAQESKYHVALVFDIIVDFAVMYAFPGRNTSETDFSSTITAMLACCGLGLDELLSRSCLVFFFFINQ